MRPADPKLTILAALLVAGTAAAQSEAKAAVVVSARAGTGCATSAAECSTAAPLTTGPARTVAVKLSPGSDQEVRVELSKLGYVSHSDDPAPEQERGYIGIEMDFVGGGLAVRNVLPNSPAAAVGLEPGDIVYLSDRAIANQEELHEVMGSASAGDVLQVTVVRDGWKKQMDIQLASRAAIMSAAESSEPSSDSREELGEEHTRELHIEEDNKLVLVAPHGDEGKCPKCKKNPCRCKKPPPPESDPVVGMGGAARSHAGEGPDGRAVQAEVRRI